MTTPDRSPPVAGMGRIRHVHFVGCGGSGMGGIAEVMLNLGYRVSGSDLTANGVTGRLRELGAVVWQGHDADQVQGADVVVVSSAIDDANPEVKAALAARIPVVPRAEMLAELMRFRFGVAVAGTHGKTTTTSLVASLLAEGGLDPTFVIGGRLNSAAANARLGRGRYLVAEADESDASFLYLQPMMAVVTNIDVDHMETYGGSFERLRRTFIEFLHHLPFYGSAVLCVDDPQVRDIIATVNRRVVTYGVDHPADIMALNLEPDGVGTRFDLQLPAPAQGVPMRLNLPGRHNVLNALAAIAVAVELGVDLAVIRDSLATFQGIGRRFQINAELSCLPGGVILVDDYGHHPREVAATLDAAREVWPDRPLVVVFQPHRYTRTRDLFEAFVGAFDGCDQLLLCRVYAAGETPIVGADTDDLINAVRARGRLTPAPVAALDELPALLAARLKGGEVVITLGAGSIGAAARRLPAQLSERLQARSGAAGREASHGA